MDTQGRSVAPYRRLGASPDRSRDGSPGLIAAAPLTEDEWHPVAAVGDIPPRFRNGYTTTEVLRYADDINPEREANAFLSAQLVWQLCSGFAQGRPWASLTFQEKETRPTDDPDVLSVRMTSDMHRALLAPKEALNLLERLLRLHEVRNRPPY